MPFEPDNPDIAESKTLSESEDSLTSAAIIHGLSSTDPFIVETARRNNVSAVQLFEILTYITEDLGRTFKDYHEGVQLEYSYGSYGSPGLKVPAAQMIDAVQAVMSKHKLQFNIGYVIP